MLISQAAIFDLDSRQQTVQRRWTNLFARLLGRSRVEETAVSLHDDVRPEVPALRIVTSEPVAADIPPNTLAQEDAPRRFPWRRHPRLLAEQYDEHRISESERIARLAAVRGIFAAREGKLDVARHFLTEAAAHPAIAFEDVPGFWGLSQQRLVVAVDAYEAAGRLRDAAALNARIRSRYRLRAVETAPRELTALSLRRAASGD